MVLSLCALGIRADADHVQNARVSRASTDLEAAERTGTTLLARARAASEGISLPETSCLAGLCEAEYARLQGRLDPGLWEAAATGWEDLGQPFRSTYARWRQAEALLDRDRSVDGAEVLHRAHQMALDVQAEPLRRQLESLAARHGVELRQPATKAGT